MNAPTARPGRRIARYVTPRLVLLVVVVLALSLSGCHGHMIRKAHAPNHQEDFDFRHPPCEPAARPAPGDGEVLLRYLGTGGLYIEWNDVAVLSAPFFTRYGLLRAAFGSVAPDAEAVREGLEGLELGRVGAVLVGHSHFDHIGDLPPMLGLLPAEAKVFVNHSGWNLLANCQGAEGRLVDLEAREPGWIWLEEGSGARLPVRMLPLESAHAPHAALFHYAKGEVTEPWACPWSGKKLRAMKEGQAFSYLIDLMFDDLQSVAFRIYYEDFASSAPLGFPPAPLLEERPVDLAILCMPSHWHADNYPQGIVEHTRARHVLAMHYEDFFRSRDEPLRFVPMLTNGRANKFMEQIDSVMSRPAHESRGPDPCTCGPCGSKWTMPLPGEWLRFKTAGRPGEP